MTSDEVKKLAHSLGADLVGVASAEIINQNPPDPKWPQTVANLWPECQSIIVIAKRMPSGAVVSKNPLAQQYTSILVMNDLDKIALKLSYGLEELGYLSSPVPQQITDLNLKGGAYGPLSLRHLAVEAGLGTLGLNLNLITPEFGPRVYLSGVLTVAKLEADKLLPRPVCLGPKCGRCVLACPGDAILHWGLNKGKCSKFAQPFGAKNFVKILNQLNNPNIPTEPVGGDPQQAVGVWQALRTGMGAYGGCPNCFLVCPIGQDYKLFKDMINIPENEEKAQKRQTMIADTPCEEELSGYLHSKRWIPRQ